MKNLLYFAVVRDGEPDPIAVFRELDEAMLWGLQVLGSDRFVIRQVALARDAASAAQAARPA
jgi:hypothetical protein